MQTGKARLAKTRATSNQSYHDQFIDESLGGEIDESVYRRPIRIVRGQSRGLIELSTSRTNVATGVQTQLQFDFNPEARSVQRANPSESEPQAMDLVRLRQPIPLHRQIIWGRFVAGFAAGGFLGLVGYAVLRVI